MGGSSSSKQVAETETPSFFTQEELSKLKSDFETSGVEKVKRLIVKKVSDFDKTEFNIAVMGEANTGKSTFINAMRGLLSTDPGAAEVGTTQTTMEPAGYSHQTLPNVRYWDLPGMGTTQFPAAKYLTEMKFKRYDFFIIVSAYRFRENEVKLAKEIKRLGKRFYFVRSKIDADLYSMRKEKGVINEEEELEKIRSDTVRRLAEAGLPDTPMFLISSFHPDHFDFIRLNEGLEGDLNNVKKRMFVLALPNLSVEIVQRKYEILKKHIWMSATLSGGLGAVPVPDVSPACDVLIGAIVQFQKSLGLDDASLQRLAYIAGKPVEELKATVKAPLLGEINPDAIMSEQVAETETSSLLTQEQLSKLTSGFETSGVEKVKRLIVKKVSDLDKTELNIAVTGESGTGKSTFINTMRGLRSNDPGAAEVGTTETTMKPTGYPHPTLPNVRYWDLPGMGTSQFPAAKYLTEMKFERFDMFIIISAVRFKENEVKLAKEIRRLGKQLYFVRSKIDADLDSMRRQKKVIKEEEELEKIRSDTVRRVEEAGFPNPTVFLISSFEPDRFDFIRLNGGLEGDLNNIKKRMIVLALPNLSVEVVQRKYEILKKHIWMSATLYGGLGVVPVPDVSPACDVLIGAIVHFQKCVGLDDASLQRLANRAGKPVEQLKLAVKAPLLREITADAIVSEQVTETETPSFFTQEELTKVKSAFETGGVEKDKALIEKKVTDLDNTELNIAVTGESGTGKSSFINAMRGLRSNDPGAAKSGTTETTKEPTGYPHPTLPNVRYWDLPGMGTSQFPAAKYLRKMEFKRYDFFIIISTVRFRENEVKLAKEIKRLGKKFYFVRSKIDADLYSMRRQKKVINEEEELEKIRSDTVRKLTEAGFLNPTVFLISSLEPDRFDFNRLNEGLEGDLNNVKKRIFVLALPNLSVEVVQRKYEILKKHIWMFATLSGGLGAVPVPGFSLACDIGILIGAIVHFRKCLGLDDASLRRLARRAGKPVEELKATVKAPLLGEITPDVIVRLGWGAAVVTISAVEFALDFVPVIGSIFGAGSSFIMTYKILSAALKDLTENAERVVKVAFETDELVCKGIGPVN